MTNQDYQGSFTANIPPREALEKISRVSEWWSNNFEGKSQKLNDVFTVQFKSGDMYKVKVSEIIPNKKIIWEVIDAYQGWVKLPTEWVGTQIIWEVIPQKDSVEVKMMHSGLVPELECFDTCTKGWNYLMLESLSKFLNEGKGHPAWS
jgi:hypothetical protein